LLANKTCIAFCDILKNASTELALSYFEKIVQNLQGGVLGFLNIKICAKFFRDYSILRTESQTQFADNLQQKYKLFDLIFEELKHYMITVRKVVNA
jgi:hypothetical protein